MQQKPGAMSEFNACIYCLCAFHTAFGDNSKPNRLRIILTMVLSVHLLLSNRNVTTASNSSPSDEPLRNGVGVVTISLYFGHTALSDCHESVPHMISPSQRSSCNQVSLV